jgi:PAS domain S-box-containing protein
MPIFTEGGSFWTNDSPELLSLPPEDDPRLNPRNRCIHAGYDSVALAPVRSKDQIIGLLQLNDRRPGRFTPERIRFFEVLANNLGLALQRRQVEEALRESESRFRTFFETVAVGTAEVDESGHFLQVNERFCQITGYSREEMLGMTPADLMHPEDRDRDKERIALHLQGDLPAYEIERRCIRKDGSVLWVQITASMIRSAEGKLLRSARIIQDITERKRAQAALLRSEKLASLGRMAATIAHEINNPLDALMNLLFLATSTADLPESARDLLEEADAELRRVAYITRQSLGFYRESGAAALTSLGAVLDSAIDLQKSRTKAKHATIDKQWHEDVHITAVGGELRQVFSNLISNSLDAIDDGGTIKVRVSKGNRRVRITIADNGKGIPPNIRQHIFEPLFTTKGTVGTGLGLWVSQQIVEKHGGAIRVRSSADGSERGTTFSVLLPLEFVPAAQSAPAVA